MEISIGVAQFQNQRVLEQELTVCLIQGTAFLRFSFLMCKMGKK